MNPLAQYADKNIIIRKKEISLDKKLHYRIIKLFVPFKINSTFQLHKQKVHTLEALQPNTSTFWPKAALTVTHKPTF